MKRYESFVLLAAVTAVLAGCPSMDTDGDGVPDQVDGCPLDSAKIEPGECGCGVDESACRPPPGTDTDGDGTPDETDGCPEEPNKTEPGDCGCGIDESDCQSSTLYVDAAALPGGNGRSWATAFRFLQDALAVAQVGATIRVAQGIYTPDQAETVHIDAGDRSVSFELTTALELQGGYAGAARVNLDPDARNVEEYVTILSGDLDGDDVADLVRAFECLGRPFDTYADGCDTFDRDGDDDVDAYDLEIEENSLHVLRVSHIDGPVTIDGLNVTGGHADGSGPLDARGGAISLQQNASLALRNCTFQHNVSAENGGAVYIASGDCTLERCRFTQNHAGEGGGIAVDYDARATLDGVIFEANRARRGAGCSNLHGALTVTNGDFLENQAGNTWEEGAFEGGAISSAGGRLTLTTCIFRNNRSLGYAGAVNTNSDTLMTDCVFEENTCHGGGAAIATIGNTLLQRCSIEHNTVYGDMSWGGDGALYVEYDLVLEDCIVTGNWSGKACGGLCQHEATGGYADTTLIDTTIAGNESQWAPECPEGATVLLLQPNYRNILEPGPVYECGNE